MDFDDSTLYGVNTSKDKIKYEGKGSVPVTILLHQ